MYDLRTFQFGKGKHKTRKDGMCVMEAVAYLAGLPHSDRPECADPVITRMAIWVNDTCDDELRNELLRDMPRRIVGTKSTPEIERQRAFMAADWAVRVVCPVLLRSAGMNTEAKQLESLSSITDAQTARAAARAASASVYAADRAAAIAVASAAARAASASVYAADSAAAIAVASAAARAASASVYAADRAAAIASAYAAASAEANAAASAAYDLEIIQRSCVDLLDRMIRLTEPQNETSAQGNKP